MKTLMKLSHTNIEYARGQDGRPGYGWNFYPGCLHKQQGVCPVPHCWAEGMSKRQRQDFHKPHLIPELLLAPLAHKKPSRILVNFMGDLFGDWVDPNMPILQYFDPPVESLSGRKIGEFNGSLRAGIFDVIRLCPQHTFLFLTKAPWNLPKWGKFPDNAWVGATVCNQEMLIDALEGLQRTAAVHKWLSIEPLLEQLNGGECEGKRLDGLKYANIDWLVIGAQSQPLVLPKLEWVEEIVEAADKAGIPVWLKDNLNKVTNLHDEKTYCEHSNFFEIGADYAFNLRQEFPK